MPADASRGSFRRYLEEMLGTGSEHYRDAVPVLFRRVRGADPESPIRSSFRLWRAAVDVQTAEVAPAVERSMDELGLDPGPDPPAAEFLYSLQAYYALILRTDRLLAMDHLLSDREVDPGQYGRLASAFDNVLEQPEDRLFSGLLGDLDLGATPFEGVLGAVADAPPRPAGEDAYKDLYQDLVGNPFRKALGEFYTRGWLADLILDRAGYDGDTLLDPACGSGAFLVKAARRVLDGADTPAAIDRVHGFDLNPVAVMAAKSNLLGVLAGHFEPGALTGAEFAALDLPVHWTNSIVWSGPDLAGNDITLLSPFGELHVPAAPDGAVAKIERDLAGRLGGDFGGAVDDAWLRDLAGSFAAPLATGPFEYVVGNPPWVSPDRMPEDYRDRVTDLLEESGFLEPFRPDYLDNRFPGGQFVAALPFFEVAMHRYVAGDGVCAYLVTSSLLKSMNGGGFREQLQDWNVTRILDFTPYTDIHERASSWGFVPVLTRSSGADGPTRYEFFLPTDGEVPAHAGDCRRVETPGGPFHVCSWDVRTGTLPFLPEDPRSPWFTAPPSVVSIYRTLTEGVPRVGENYRFTRGVVTGRNSVYLLDEVETRGDHVTATSGASEGRVTLDPDLVYPFVEGKHLDPWAFDHTHVLLPYDLPEWEPIPEARLETEYPETASYLSRNRAALEGRRTHTITRQLEDGAPFYVVETRSVLGRDPVVGVREVAPHLEAAVIPPAIEDDLLGERRSVVAHTLNFVVPDSAEEAHYLAGLLNAWPLRTLLYDLAQPKGGRPGKRYDMYLVGSLPVPAFDPSKDAHARIADLSRRAHEAADRGGDVGEIEADLDAAVSAVYGLSAGERETLRAHYRRLAYTPEG